VACGMLMLGIIPIMLLLCTSISLSRSLCFARIFISPFSRCVIYFIYRYQKCTSTSIITFLLSYCTKYNVQQFNVQQVLLAKRPQESHTSYWTSLIPKVSAKSWKFKGRPRHINHHPDTKSTITWKYHQGDHHQKNQHQNY
jgi:hypothetical protein